MPIKTLASLLRLALGLLLVPAALQAQAGDQREDLVATAAARTRPGAAEIPAVVVRTSSPRAAALLKAEASRLGWTSTRSEAGIEQWSAVTDSGTVQVRVDLEPAPGGTRLRAGGDERGKVLAQKLLLLARRSGLQ